MPTYTNLLKSTDSKQSFSLLVNSGLTILKRSSEIFVRLLDNRLERTLY
jgi:hypothetical protein